MKKIDSTKNTSSYIGTTVFKYIPQGVKGEPFTGVLCYTLRDNDHALFEMGEYDYHYVHDNALDIRNSYIRDNMYLYRACLFKTNLDVWMGDFSY